MTATRAGRASERITRTATTATAQHTARRRQVYVLRQIATTGAPGANTGRAAAAAGT